MAVTSRVDNSIVRSALVNTPSRTMVITRVMSETGSVASTGAGVINSLFSFAPTSFTDWSSLTALYDEFRVVGAEIEFFCAQSFQLPSALAGGILIVVYDNDDATSALTSSSQALDYSTKVTHNLVWSGERSIKLKATCFSIADASSGTPWSTTATPAAYPHSFKTYCASLTASTTYLFYAMRLVVQLRGQT